MQTENVPQPTRWVDKETGRWVLFSTILASAMAFIDASALNVALDAIQASLGATAPQLFWMVNAYALLLAGLIITGGSLGDHFGRRRVFMIGIVVFALASLACGLAPTPGFLIGARAVQGIGGALMVPGSLAIISASFGPGERGKAIGAWSSFTTIVTVLAPLAGGYLAGQGLWRLIFLINLPLAVASLAALALRVPESRDTTISTEIDWAGTALITLSLAGLTFGFTEVSERGWRHPAIVGSLAAGAAAFVAFLVIQARSKHPLVPFSLFRSRTFTGTNLLTFFLYGALYGALIFFPLLLIQAQGYPEVIAGLAFLPFSILLALLSRWAGGLVDTIGPRLPLIAGPAIVGVGFLLFSLVGLTDGPQSYWVTYFPGVLGVGLGMAITVAPLTTAVMGSAPSAQVGIASGINNAVSRTGGVLAIAILSAILLAAFASSLRARIASLGLTPDQEEAVMQEAINLGNAQIPTGMAVSTERSVRQAIRESFVQAFRVICWIGMAMAWTSALMSAALVEPRLQTPPD